MKVLVACEFSGIVREAFNTRGHDAWSCDIIPTEIKGKHIVNDVRNILDAGWDMMIAFPPCTHLSLSGARWWPEKRADGRQQKAIEFFRVLYDTDIPKIVLENPIGILSTAFIKPNQIIQPWQFGHGETKATCLWLKGVPNLIPTDIVEGREQRVWKAPDSKGRDKNRSRTYIGIAKAMAEQWG